MIYLPLKLLYFLLLIKEHLRRLHLSSRCCLHHHIIGIAMVVTIITIINIIITIIIIAIITIIIINES